MDNKTMNKKGSNAKNSTGKQQESTNRKDPSGKTGGNSYSSSYTQGSGTNCD